MKNKLLKYIERNKKYAVNLVSRLIEIPTVNPPGINYEKMVDFLEKECGKLGLKTKRHATPKKTLYKHGVKMGSQRVSLVCDWGVGAKKTLHINSHYDVVPAIGKWLTEPFEAVKRGDRIYGRGSEDMKGNIASVLYALEALKKTGIKPKVNIQVSFTPDEEIGGRTGLGYLVQKNLVKADCAMSEGYSGNHVSIGNKGVLWAEVTVKGKACHASMPHKGVNAFERMILLVKELDVLKKKVVRRRTRNSMKDTVSKNATFVMGGLLEGGVKVNVVPGEAMFSIDRRLIPEEGVAAAKKEIDVVIKKFNRRYRDSIAIIKYASQENPAISEYDSRFFKTVSRSISMVIGRPARFSVMPGATDMRYFMWKGVPCLGYSASGGGKWHADNEYVSIKSLVDTAKIYALVIGNLE